MIVIILFAIASQETRLCPAEICFSGHMLSGQRHNPVKQSSVLNASIKVWLRYFLCFSRGKSFLNHSSLPIPQKLMMPFFREKGMSSKKQKMEEKKQVETAKLAGRNRTDNCRKKNLHHTLTKYRGCEDK